MPLGSHPLRDLAQGRRTAAIVVDDVSRSVPSAELLPGIVDELRAGGIALADITVVVATGLHRPLTESELDATRGGLPVRIVNHDAERKDELVSIGATSLGQEIKINRVYMAADLKVLVGDVEFHQFCGYGGGAKSVYPGIADAESIRHNHSMMEVEGAGPGRWEGNPVRQEIEEVGRMAGADFLLSVVMNSGREVVCAHAGDVVEAFLAGRRVVDEMYRIAVPRAVDLVIVSAGGDPKDIDLYQAQKAVTAGRRIVRRGGTIAVIAECPEGHGSELFDRWMKEAESVQDVVERIREKFVMGGHKAYQFAREIAWAEVCLLSALPSEQVRAYFMTPLGSARDLVELVGRAGTVAALPQATLTLAEIPPGRP
jgi:nickel-dependent lactate racemase